MDFYDDSPEDHDEEDVASALERDTADGPGFDSEDELPAGDYGEENAK